MKKIMIMAASLVMAVATHAASFNWAAANIFGSDLTTKYSGEINLYAVIDGTDTLVNTYTAASGVVNKTSSAFTNDSLVGGNDYDFYFTFVDNGKKFTSGIKNVGALATATATIAFGNMATATQTASNWAPIPEPTSAFLLLLGLGGLALKRKRA